jgi:hypothetical protein
MLISGLTSGIVVAGLFNPWDRALYLSVLHVRPFLRRENFAHPYQGFWQVLAHRTLSGGLYFPLFDAAQPSVSALITSWAASDNFGSGSTAAEQSALLHFTCGNFAGGVSGVLLNALTAIKYASWDARTGFYTTARNMFEAGGLRPFGKGVTATVMRDTVFGGVFAVTKFQMARTLQPFVMVHHHHVPIIGKTFSEGGTAGTRLPGVSNTTAAALLIRRDRLRAEAEEGNTQKRIQMSAGTMDFTAALLAGLAATCVSSPFNYVRNIKYGWPSSQMPPSAPRIMYDLWIDASQSGRMLMHIQERLRLGWGTARVAVGMAVGQYLYESTKALLDDRYRGTAAR